MFRYLPFAFFLACCAVFVLALYYQPKTPSRMLGQEVVLDGLQPLEADAASPADGNKRIINLFASWCVPCIAELPYLQIIHDQTGAPVIGVAWKDKPEVLPDWLLRYGNPFQSVLLDVQGHFGINLGIKGLPETFVIDAHNRIIYHHAGPITEADIDDIVEQLE